MNDFAAWKRSRASATTSSGLGESMRAELGRTIRDAWWRRGGELLEQALDALPGGAPSLWVPQPSNSADIHRALMAGTLGGTETWVFEPEHAAPGRLQALAAVISETSVHDHPLTEVLRDKIAVSIEDESIQRRIADRQITNAELEAWSIRRWAGPTDEAITAAVDLLRSGDKPLPSHHKPRLTADDVSRVLADVLQSHAPTWSVRIATSTATAMTRSHLREIVVSDQAAVTAFQLRRLVAHEIGGHVYRSTNAAACRGLLGGLALGDHASATEEGLALAVEERLGVASARQSRTYAARAIGVALAHSGGIVDVHRGLTPWVGAEAAATIAVRVKRGVPDMHLPGAFTKDHIYFSGALSVRRLLTEQPSSFARLMRVKWSSEVVESHRDLIEQETGGLILPDHSLMDACDRAIDRVLRADHG